MSWNTHVDESFEKDKKHARRYKLYKTYHIKCNDCRNRYWKTFQSKEEIRKHYNEGSMCPDCETRNLLEDKEFEDMMRYEQQNLLTEEDIPAFYYDSDEDDDKYSETGKGNIYFPNFTYVDNEHNLPKLKKSISPKMTKKSKKSISPKKKKLDTKKSKKWYNLFSGGKKRKTKRKRKRRKTKKRRRKRKTRR